VETAYSDTIVITMRLWSIHPKYLDSKGLVALWRETLLAQKCLAGQTKGYYNHPQLNRFKETSDSMASIGTYLTYIVKEADQRKYNFDESKITIYDLKIKMKVTKGQLEYEWQHFLKKIYTRDQVRHKLLINIKLPEAHSMLTAVDGDIESWESV
jgi:hypothetical protein